MTSMSMEEMKRNVAEKKKALRSTDPNPCEFCGHPNDGHIYLTSEEIAKYRRMGSPVTICESQAERLTARASFTRRNTGASEINFIFCFIHPPPDNPCDEESMRDISS